MCISRSVGHSGQNDFTDVTMFQTLFNLNRHRLSPPVPAKLKVDGKIGQKTIKAIVQFETQVLGLQESDGIVTNGDSTMKALVAGLQPGLSEEKLTAIIPYATPANIKRYHKPLLKAMANYDIDTSLRMMHFIAQIAHESGSLRYSEEIASGQAYEGRADLGNSKAGDGKRFKGRGLIQLTGRHNYQEYSDDTGIDYVANPNRLSSDPNAAIDVACWYWKKHGINRWADRDDVKTVTKLINGGFNGLDERKAFLERARCLLGE